MVNTLPGEQKEKIHERSMLALVLLSYDPLHSLTHSLTLGLHLAADQNMQVVDCIRLALLITGYYCSHNVNKLITIMFQMLTRPQDTQN